MLHGPGTFFAGLVNHLDEDQYKTLRRMRNLPPTGGGSVCGGFMKRTNGNTTWPGATA